MALNIHELASIIASGQHHSLNSSSESYFHIPLTFLYEGYEINQRATALLHRNPDGLNGLWTCLNVTREQMEASWGNWIDLAKKQLLRVYNARSKAIVCLDILRNFFETL